MAQASLHDSWARRGQGYLIGALWLPDVAYADDVVLLAMSITAWQTMLLEVEEAFHARRTSQTSADFSNHLALNGFGK